MTYHLAEKLGMTVKRLRREVDGREFSEWMGFFEWREQERANAERRSGGPRAPSGMGR